MAGRLCEWLTGSRQMPPFCAAFSAFSAARSHRTGERSADQAGQVGKDQDQGCGEYDQARLPDFGLFEHGHLPFVFVGVASNARSQGLSGCSVTPARGLKNRPGKTRRRLLPLHLDFVVFVVTLGGMSQVA